MRSAGAAATLGEPAVPDLRREETDAQRVRARNNGLSLASDLSFQGWLSVGRQLCEVSNASCWCLGDWLLFGERAYGERYKFALTVTTLDYQTLRNYAWVARRFKVSRRRDTLSFQHHAEVAALSEPEQELWLHRADANCWSRNELRRHLVSNRRSRTDRILDSMVTVSIRTSTSREQRWKRAALAVSMEFGQWLALAADAAAREQGASDVRETTASQGVAAARD